MEGSADRHSFADNQPLTCLFFAYPFLTFPLPFSIIDSGVVASQRPHEGPTATRKPYEKGWMPRNVYLRLSVCPKKKT